MSEPISTRLNKRLALVLGISRREADAMIAANRVTLDDNPAELGARFVSGQVIKVDGQKIAEESTYKYLVLNKPVGYVSSRKAQGDNPTLYALLPKEFHTLKPVGRLDKDSSGLILLTNDGDFAHRNTHPSFYKTKIYKITLGADLQPLHQQMINDFGVQLEDGPSKLTLERLNEANRKEWQVTMHEGRNRQIRRTFAALGYTVTKLHRTNFGDYALGDIKPGKYAIVNMR